MLFRRNKEAAFSNYRLWESAGFVIAYAYSTTLCARMKLYVLFGNLVLGIIGYVIVEIRHRRKVIIVIDTLATNTNDLTEIYSFCDQNRNVGSRNKKLKRMRHAKLKRPNDKKSKKLTMKRMIWKKILKLHISKLLRNLSIILCLFQY